MKAHNCTRSQAKKALKQLAQLNNNSTSGTKVKKTSNSSMFGVKTYPLPDVIDDLNNGNNIDRPFIT